VAKIYQSPVNSLKSLNPLLNLAQNVFRLVREDFFRRGRTSGDVKTILNARSECPTVSRRRTTRTGGEVSDQHP
jgi:hypothetical protein